MPDYPTRSVRIVGTSAAAALNLYTTNQHVRNNLAAIPVSTAEDIAMALGDDGNEHLCPLCNEYFASLPFAAHAQACINARAPRVRSFGQGRFATANSPVRYNDTVKEE